MTNGFKTFTPIIFMCSLFVLVDLLSFLLTKPFETQGIITPDVQASSSNLSTLVIFFAMTIVFTAVILAIAKYNKMWVIRGIFLSLTVLLSIYVFYPLLNYILSTTASVFVSLIPATILLILLIKYPEWYIIDIAGVITAVGVVTMMGLSLNILIVLLLLIGMSVYDAISVYKTKHMITLADKMITLKLPILYVIPKSREYSLIKDNKSLKDKLKSGDKPNSFFMGLGDIVIPGILAVTVFHNSGLLEGLSVIAGTLIGFCFLMFFVLKGKPQAGLPLLCSGAILGYIISSFILTGTWSVF
jgi:presenilin-like A22 family membrane protease